jgi:hypothetical protein
MNRKSITRRKHRKYNTGIGRKHNGCNIGRKHIEETWGRTHTKCNAETMIGNFTMEGA